MNLYRLGTLAVVVLGLGAVAAPANSADKHQPKAASTPAAATNVDALAQRACDALHALPATRKQECCGGAAANLATVCAQELGAALQRGSVKLDADRIDRCAADSAKSLQGCAWITPLSPKLEASCATLIQGSLKDGSSCRSSLECTDGSYCRGVTPTSAGVCGAPAAPGARCENPADNLASFLRDKDDARHPLCQGACLKGQCLAFVAEGAACPSTAACAAGLNCLDGKCQAKPLPALGQACSGIAECGGGAVCTDGKCAAPKDTGATCKLPFECRSLECRKEPTAESGVCADVCAAVRATGGLPR